MTGDRELRFTFIYWFAQNRLPEGRVLRSYMKTQTRELRESRKKRLRTLACQG